MLLRKVARQSVIAAGYPLACALAGRPPKKISAVMRVKNEAEFLERSINSVIDLVDELVIVDNCSTDRVCRNCCRLFQPVPQKK